MQQDEGNVTVWGFAEHLSGDEYAAYWESNPIYLELASDEIIFIEFQDLRSLEDAAAALQSNREGRLGVRQYNATSMAFSDIRQIMLKPYKPAEPVYLPGTLSQKILSRTAPQGRLWIEGVRVFYSPDQEPTFVTIYRAMERALNSSSGRPKSLLGNLGSRIPRRNDTPTPGPKASGPDMSDRCPHCGQPTAPGSNFCPQCGGQLGMFCPSCQHAIKAGDNFCPNCGERIAPSSNT